MSGLYRISAANVTSSAFRERGSTSLFEGKQQLYSQQLSAAVRAGQQLKMVDEEPASEAAQVGDFCQDGKTRKVVSVSAGCRSPAFDDMTIRSTCEEDQMKGKRSVKAQFCAINVITRFASDKAKISAQSFPQFGSTEHIYLK